MPKFKKTKNFFLGPFIWIFPCIIFLMVVYIFPLIYTFALSFHRYDSTHNIFYFYGLSNYINLLKDNIFLDSVKFTLIFTAFAAIPQFLLGFGLALFFCLKFRGKKYLRAIMVIPTIVTPMIAGLMWRLLLNTDRGLINFLLSFIGIPRIDWIGQPITAVISCILVDSWEWTAFIFLILYAGLQVLPVAPFEAAKIDGASRLQIFRYITLPLLQPIIMVAIIFRGVDAFRIFDIIYTTTYGGPSHTTYSLHFFGYKTMFTYSRIGYASAVSYIMFMICMIFMFAYYKTIYKK